MSDIARGNSRADLQREHLLRIPCLNAVSLRLSIGQESQGRVSYVPGVRKNADSPSVARDDTKI